MTKGKTDSIDQYIGQRLRTIRHIRRFSQAELGQLIGVSFQQIQKYENARNRVSASRLYHISAALKVNPLYFYEDVSMIDEKTAKMISRIMALKPKQQQLITIIIDLVLPK